MTILGISCFYHESAACIVQDGIIVAATAEERFTRIKHDSAFPKHAIDFCLKTAKITSAELDYVVFYEKPFLKFERNLITSIQNFPKSLSFFIDSTRNSLTEKLWVKSIISQKLSVNSNKILFSAHHVSHAAASFYPSPFESAAYVTLDGIGEWTTGSFGYARENKIYPISEMKFPHSVGLLYSTVTAFLGFMVNDGEYKVMGMAAYGKPRLVSKFKKLYKQNKDGTIQLNLNYFAFNYSSKRMYSDQFIELFQNEDRFDIAASLQYCIEEIVFSILNFVQHKTREINLVFGGGVALNSVLNGKITQKTAFNDVFIFPAAGDDGGALGAALYVYHHILGFKKRDRVKNVFLGEGFKEVGIEDFLQKNKIKYKKLPLKKRAEYIAKKLTEGFVVGLFEGRAEFGPRALGHRSILADARNPHMKNIINTKVKYREEFRPFAPVILSEYASLYFKNLNKNLTAFMTGTISVKPKTKKLVPSVVHKDNTSRIQCITKDFSGILRGVLEEFYALTGIPILLNTSFNTKGEPIVNSPLDAYKTFKKSGIDILILENCVVEKVGKIR